MLRYAIPAALVLTAGNAWAQQKAVTPMEEPKLGDHWTYQLKDEITGKATGTRENVVTEVTPDTISLRFKKTEPHEEGLSLYDHSWNVLNSANWKYVPYQGSSGIHAPLKVGEHWTFESNNFNKNGSVSREIGLSMIVGQEAVTTPAGTFDTFKIETSFSTQNARDLIKKYDTVFQTWYAPAIDHWVKRLAVFKINGHLDRSESYELIEYGRKQ